MIYDAVIVYIIKRRMVWWLMNNEWKIILKEVGKPRAQHIHKPAHWTTKYIRQQVPDAGKPEQLSRYSGVLRAGLIAGRGNRFLSILLNDSVVKKYFLKAPNYAMLYQF